MVERLYEKGFLEREPGEQGLLYRSAKSRKVLDQNVVSDFVTVAPLVSFLASVGEVSDSGLAQSRRLLENLEKGRRR